MLETRTLSHSAGKNSLALRAASIFVEESLQAKLLLVDSITKKVGMQRGVFLWRNRRRNPAPKSHPGWSFVAGLMYRRGVEVSNLH